MENSYFRDVLLAKGYIVIYQEYKAGHSYLNAKGSLAEGLIALIGTENKKERQ